MDMSEMSMTGETPPNANESYSKNLVTIICCFIGVLTIRHISKLLYSKVHFIHHLFTPLATFYQRIERRIINICSLQFFSAVCPPIGGFLIVLIMICAILPLLLLNTNLAVNSNRAGFLVLALVPFLLSSTGKNSAVALFTGISSVKLNFIHRMLGYAIFLLATVHMSCMLYSWTKFPKFLASQLALTKVQYGLAGYGCLCVVILFSFLPVRMFSFELFLFTHLFGFGFIGVIALHTPYAMRYFFTGLVCYCLNLVAVWFVKSYLAQARFEILPDGCTKVSIRLASPMKHSIGQHINLCIPSISPFEWHPFTITSVSQNHSTTVEVHVCSRGNFTRKLYNIDPSQDLRVFITGPFGSSQIQSTDVLERYTSIVIASGGAGITFGIRMIREITDRLLKMEEMGKDLNLETKDIYFSWCTKRGSELEWFKEELEQINYIYDLHSQFPTLHIQFHTSTVDADIQESVTTDDAIIKESVTTDTIQEESSQLFKEYPKKPIELIQGKRLDIGSLLAIQDKNTGVYVCGPASFNATFKNCVALHHTSTIDLHCEDFGY